MCVSSVYPVYILWITDIAEGSELSERGAGGTGGPPDVCTQASQYRQKIIDFWDISKYSLKLSDENYQVPSDIIKYPYIASFVLENSLTLKIYTVILIKEILNLLTFVLSKDIVPMKL